MARRQQYNRQPYIIAFIIMLIFVIILAVCYAKQKTLDNFYEYQLDFIETTPPDSGSLVAASD